MRIVNRKQFLDMAAGTVYCKYAPHWFGDVRVKQETEANDWWYIDLNTVASRDTGDWIDRIDEAVAGGSIPMDFETRGRDGLYEDWQLFAVYEHDDVIGMIALLVEAIGAAYPAPE